MAQKYRFEFFLLRYAPNALSDEFMNIGIVLFDPAALLTGFFAARFIVDWERLQTFDDDAGIALIAWLDAPDDGFPILSGEDVNALLIGNKRRLRNHYLLLRVAKFEFEADKLPIDECTRRIWESGARQDGVGAAIDAHIDEVDAAFLLVRRAVGKSKVRLDAADVDFPCCRLRAQEFPLADREGHVHRILADDDRKGAARRADR